MQKTHHHYDSSRRNEGWTLIPGSRLLPPVLFCVADHPECDWQGTHSEFVVCGRKLASACHSSYTTTDDSAGSFTSSPIPRLPVIRPPWVHAVAADLVVAAAVPVPHPLVLLVGIVPSKGSSIVRIVTFQSTFSDRILPLRLGGQPVAVGVPVAGDVGQIPTSTVSSPS